MLQETDQPVDGPLQRHISATYYTLRWGVAALGVLFPIALSVGGYLLGDLPLQASMSDYYHAPEGAATGVMRDWFVGFLFALAALMYLYKGFTRLENVLLNIAGLLALGVAIFPNAWPPASATGLFSVHGVCAVGAFACLALVAWLSPKRSLVLMPEGRQRRAYAAAYRVAATGMLLSPLVAWLLISLAGQQGKLIFVIETLALLAFVGYWVTKSFEMHETHGELKALRGALVYRK
jgi:hypothetical protein